MKKVLIFKKDGFSSSLLYKLLNDPDLRSQIEFVEIESALDGTKSEQYDLSLCIGGDGTVVDAGKRMPGVPIMAFNAGRVGFLAPHNINDLMDCIQLWLEGKYTTSKRSTLAISVPLAEYIAVNDIVFQRDTIAYTPTFTMRIGSDVVGSVRADGIIVSTATGSTAYSMSAGGAILHPTLEANIITPICPISTGFKPVVLPNDRDIGITLTSKNKTFILIDGKSIGLANPSTEYLVTKGPEITMIRVVDKAQRFLESVKEKLNWIT